MNAGPLEILHEDNHLLGVLKPAGLLVQGDRSGDPSLLEIARDYLKRTCGKPGRAYVGLVHRLDRNVSGVVVLARTSKAAGRLSRQFREGTVAKTYLAAVERAPREEAGELVAWLGAARDRLGRTPAAPAPFDGAREARLRFRVLERARGGALLEVDLLTGRRHQIRAQLALIGCPVLGDVKYGAAAPLPARRIGLHARRLVFAHPVTAEPVTLTAEPPGDWPWPGPAADRSTGK